MAEDEICNLIKSFFEEKTKKICPEKEEKFNFEYDIYNEFSLQHELGIYLREKLDATYKILFEKNVIYICDEIYKDSNDWAKQKIDILIVKKDENKWKPFYAIELKFPPNEAYTKRMGHFIEDMKFMEQVKDRCPVQKTYCLTLTNNPNFYSDHGKNKNTGIYEYFRNNIIKIPSNEKISCKKRGKTIDIILTKTHITCWEKINDVKNVRYYIDIIE